MVSFLLRRDRSYGFHIVDLIAMLGVLSAVGIFALPSLSHIRAQRTLAFEAERLKTVLETLVVSTAQREKEVTLVLSATEYHTQAKETVGPTLVMHQLPPGIKIALKTNTTRSLTFYQGGVNTPGTITLASKSSHCDVIISLRGRVKLTCG